MTLKMKAFESIVEKVPSIFFLPTRNVFYSLKMFSTLSNIKISDWSKLKAFADDMFKVAQIADFFLDRVGNIVGKRRECLRKCWLATFSPFPILFSKCFFCRVIDTSDKCKGLEMLKNDFFPICKIFLSSRENIHGICLEFFT